MKKLFRIIGLIIVISLAYGCRNEKNDGYSSNSSSSSETVEQNLTQEEIWTALNGFWSSNNIDFVFFLQENNKNIMNFGIWYSEVGRKPGEVVATNKIAIDKYLINIRFYAQEETMLTAAYPDETVEFELDLSEIDADRISIKKEDNTVTQYHYFGETFEEALGNLE